MLRAVIEYSSCPNCFLDVVFCSDNCVVWVDKPPCLGHIFLQNARKICVFPVHLLGRPPTWPTSTTGKTIAYFSIDLHSIFCSSFDFFHQMTNSMLCNPAIWMTSSSTTPLQRHSINAIEMTAFRSNCHKVFVSIEQFPIISTILRVQTWPGWLQYTSFCF